VEAGKISLFAQNENESGEIFVHESEVSEEKKANKFNVKVWSAMSAADRESYTISFVFLLAFSRRTCIY
jgi:hypothetical protein